MQLSKKYTNHSIRVTVVTSLYEAGWDNTKIQSVTGHRTSASVDRYKRLRSDDSKFEASEVLGMRLQKESKLNSDKTTAEVPLGEKVVTKEEETKPTVCKANQAIAKNLESRCEDCCVEQVDKQNGGASKVAPALIGDALGGLQSLFSSGTLTIQNFHVHMNTK